MNIGLNALGFLPGKTGGIEVYFKNLLQALQLIDRKNDYSLVCNPENADYFDLFNSAFHVVTLPFSRSSTPWYIRGIVRNLFNLDVMKWLFSRFSFHVLHHPSVVFVPLGLKMPSVVTYHDMQHVFYPEFFTKRQLQVRCSTDRAVFKEVRKVIAISEFTKRCLIEKYNITEEKIVVIYHGISPGFYNLSDAGKLNTVAEKYKLNNPFLFYPSAPWPHKNHLNLFYALKGCKTFDGTLVLTGIGMNGRSKVEKTIHKLGLTKRVRILGFVPDEDFPYLYRLALGLVYPSLFEGFGLPILEAMASGCPVACSYKTSLPEVAGKAGIYFDPLSPENMAEAISVLWHNEKTRMEKTALGFEQAKRFSLEAMAEKTVLVYESISE